MNKTLLAFSLIFLALVVYAPIETFLLREYHTHQRAYREALVEKAASDTELEAARDYPVGIKQLVLPDLGRIDRCVSCHVGLEDPRMTDQLQPLTTHPGRYLQDHDTAKIGCTVCHDGQGRATIARDAHAQTIEGWEKPILKAPFIQANCMRCHDADDSTEGMDVVRAGEHLFHSKGCMGCHKMYGRGGQLAVDLTHIGDASPKMKRPLTLETGPAGETFHDNANLAYIFESVKSPAAQPAITAMMDFQFTDDEALALTVYLKGLSKREVPASYLAKRQEARWREGERGEDLFNKYCVACHGAGGKGGVENRNYAKGTVPALNTMAEKFFIEWEDDAEYLSELLMNGEDILNMDPPLDVDNRSRVLAQYRAVKNIVKYGNTAGKADPDGLDPLLHMPSWVAGLDDSHIDSIIAYLLSQYPWEDEEN